MFSPASSSTDCLGETCGQNTDCLGETCGQNTDCLGETCGQNLQVITNCMFWGCLRLDGVGTFVSVNAKWQYKFYEIYRNFGRKSLAGSHKCFCFSKTTMQPSSLKMHNAMETWEQFTNNVEAQSQDLNVVENVWQDLLTEESKNY